MIPAHEQDDTERYLFFSYGSNGEGKIVFQFTCIQLHFYIKIHAPRTHICTKNDDDQNFN